MSIFPITNDAECLAFTGFTCSLLASFFFQIGSEDAYGVFAAFIAMNMNCNDEQICLFGQSEALFHTFFKTLLSPYSSKKEKFNYLALVQERLLRSRNTV